MSAGIQTLSITCPAKINRHLRIGEPDAIGYHPLETEFQAISLGDTLILTPGDSGLTIEGPEAGDLPQEADNTVLKALRLMREVATLPPFGLKLIKRIPSQAGLGGGSSDAAGLIRGLRQLLHQGYPQRDFDMVARGVGADVPFFLVGGRALGEGYGEKLTPLEDKEPEHLVIALGARCATPAMYKALDQFRQSGAQPRDFEGLAENSFHAVAPEECLNALQLMREVGLEQCALSGSGAAVFGFAESKELADQAADKLRADSYQTWTSRTLTRAESLKIDVLPH